MRLEQIGVGDLVLCQIKGRRIYGEVLKITDGTVEFRPLCPAAGWRHASAREITAHWRKTGRRATAGAPATNEPGVSSEPLGRVPREQLSLPLHR